MSHATSTKTHEANGPLETTSVLTLVAGVLLALVGLCVAFGGPPGNPLGVTQPLIVTGAAAAAFVVVGVQLRRRATSRWVGAAWALASLSVVVIIGLALSIVVAILAALKIFVAPGEAIFKTAELAIDLFGIIPGAGWVLVIGYFLICFALLHYAKRARLSFDDEGRDESFASASVIWLVGILALAVVGAIPSQAQRDAYKREAAARLMHDRVGVHRRLRRAQSCLLWQETSRLVFPGTIDSAGKFARCLERDSRPTVAATTRLRYARQFTTDWYHPQTFWLALSPSSRKAPLSEVLYADDAGLIYRLVPGSLGSDTASFPPIVNKLEAIDSPLEEINELQNCLVERGRASAGYPASLAGSGCGKPSTVRTGDPNIYSFDMSDGDLSVGTYSIQYWPRRKLGNGRFAAFELDVRPESYGLDGIRSYRRDESGKIHWTALETAASNADPVVEECAEKTPCERPVRYP